ncbi:mce associated protein mas1a [Rhodococcus sp. SGAir0479]|uniref:mce associated protein mas1a n=1 Tax=Rhodococcus sp. SGAir0479 TaxID=2567884 RepID=UPI0010CD56D8|nr:mce associated protein mas1a [Rhodococcus sp. SGAir0479]QCQ93366.1 mce associated protein mas1a [Rhodococcus sp. SGAir0479]
MANDDPGIDPADGATAVATLPESSAGPGPADGGHAREPRTVSRIVPTILAVVVAGFAALSAVLGWQVWQQHRADALRAEAVDTTRDYAQTIATFDYKDLNANRDKIAGMSTQDFAGKYNEMVDALGKLVTDGQGTATATVTDIGVESVDDERAVVLAFVDQEAKNVIAPEGKSQKYRMVVSLTRDGDRWIVENLETK